MNQLMDFFEAFVNHLNQGEASRLARQKKRDEQIEAFKTKTFFDPSSRTSMFDPQTKKEKLVFGDPWQSDDLRGMIGRQGIARMGMWGNTQW